MQEGKSQSSAVMTLNLLSIQFI